MLAVVVLSACTASKHAQAPSSPFTATERTEVVYLVPRTETVSPTPDLASIPEPTPTPIPTPTPTLAPPTPPAVYAAETSGVPWFVPPEWHSRYLECVASPYRYTVTEMVWAMSREGGREDGWAYKDAMYVVEHEGGNDYCQFNTQGSGACGPFQLLTCPPDGLTPEGQSRGAFAKWLDGGRSFARHWFAFWTN